MEEKVQKEVKIVKNINRYGGGGGAVYGLGFVGALIYFLQHSLTFADGVMGVLKAIVWPALLVFRVLQLLRM